MLFMNVFQKIYKKAVIDSPIIAIFLVAITVLFFAFNVQHFRLDASSDSLALENDRAVKYYRSIKARYGSDDYLIVTYKPRAGELFTPEVLADLGDLKGKLLALDSVKTVTSILDVPLIESPPVTLEELGKKIHVLTDEGTDLKSAREEFLASPLYRDLLISDDSKITAIFIDFHVDKKLEDLFEARNALREKSLEADFASEENGQLKAAEQNYTEHRAKFQDKWHRDIADVRDILAQHKERADIYLGGVPMIVADSIAFIGKDLKVFGSSILIFIIILLALIFRKLQWVLLPILVCISVGVCAVGFLGLINCPVTIVSSNFIALLLIFTLSFCVHEIVRYRECVVENPQANQRELVSEMVSSIGSPCFYMVFTTMVAFGSLVVSGIRPIIDFGWMMAFGLGVSFIISFTLLPAVLVFLKPEKEREHYDFTHKVTNFFVQMTEMHGKLILAVFAAIVVFSVWGMSFLYVQNSFIDYYKQDTDIYKGMEVIDVNLGGTTPLEIIIDAPREFIEFQKEEAELMEEDGFAMADSSPILNGYWFSDIVMDEVGDVHEYLDSLPETGKVLSFYTSVQLLQNLKDARLVDRFYLGVLYNKLPNEVKDFLFAPYISEDGNQLRFAIRIFESMDGLDRQELLDKIQDHLTVEMGLVEEQIHMTGMVVLYNNILQTLFQSQILTIWVVFVIMFIMFLILFRNIWVALVAIIPNITITAFVLGVMGWMDIPLDIMTITIAAICFGIADDNTVHYVYRFMEEFKKDRNYKRAIEMSHDTIGRAMYYTGITIMLGFSILAFSNFVPTIYFGVLTSISMVVALFGNIMLLPALILLFKPLGKEG